MENVPGLVRRGVNRESWAALEQTMAEMPYVWRGDIGDPVGVVEGAVMRRRRVFWVGVRADLVATGDGG